MADLSESDISIITERANEIITEQYALMQPTHQVTDIVTEAVLQAEKNYKKTIASVKRGLADVKAGRVSKVSL